MKDMVHHITVFIIISLAFSCSNDFLKDETERTFSESASIVISPDWDAQDYVIHCPDVGNAKFKVVQAPDWLKISTRSGQFANGFATLNCKANTHDEFSEVGIYYSYMTLSVEGKGNQTILIAYMTEGNPVVETESNSTIDFNFYGGVSVRNTGNGILLLSVVELPEWLSLYEYNGGENVTFIAIEEYPAIVLPPSRESFIPLRFNQTVPLSENLSGKIFLITNDKNRPVVEVDVQFDLGSPQLRYYSSDHLDFGRAETIIEICFSNRGNGLLLWEIEGCPEWLSVSESNGSLLWEYKYLTFTCNRNLLPPGENSVTIYLKTNDKNMPSYPISVTAIKE